MTALFDLGSVIYAILGLRVLWESARRWRELRDGNPTPTNLGLAWNLGFFVLAPFGVVAHEAAHLVAAKGLGAWEADIHFRLYWGYVSYWPRLDPQSEFAVAAAGPAASLVLGLIALGFALRLPRLWSEGLQSFGLATLALDLVIYPVMSYWWSFGDFRMIYGSAPHLSLLAAVVHVAGLVIFAVAAGRLAHQSRAVRWAGHAAMEPERRLRLAPEHAERLRVLEASWTRVLPGARQELNQLRELRDWIAEHNRGIEAQPQGRNAEAVGPAGSALESPAFSNPSGTHTQPEVNGRNGGV